MSKKMQFGLGLVLSVSVLIVSVGSTSAQETPCNATGLTAYVVLDMTPAEVEAYFASCNLSHHEIMETLFLVFQGSIEEHHIDKQYYLAQLLQYNISNWTSGWANWVAQNVQQDDTRVTPPSQQFGGDGFNNGAGSFVNQ